MSLNYDKNKIKWKTTFAFDVKTAEPEYLNWNDYNNYTSTVGSRFLLSNEDHEGIHLRWH